MPGLRPVSRSPVGYTHSGFPALSENPQRVDFVEGHLERKQRRFLSEDRRFFGGHIWGTSARLTM